MFVDASVIVAVLGREPGCEELEKRLAAADGPLLISPLVKFEASVALARLKTKMRPSPDLIRQAQAAVDAFIAALDVEEIDITPEIGGLAVEAGATYGKVVGHVAGLNFGDCFAYACAKARGTTLLYKGYDFVHTDLA